VSSGDNEQAMSSKKDGELYKILNNGGWTAAIVIVSGNVLAICGILLYISYLLFRELAIVTTL
tara:strand:+ start:373 stop:561 length:189 start_codon:yes stop_codon:yes gene_type:complete